MFMTDNSRDELLTSATDCDRQSWTQSEGDACGSEQAVNTSTIAVPTKKSDRAVAGKKKNKKKQGQASEAGG